MNLNIATARFGKSVLVADNDGVCWMSEVTEGVDCRSLHTNGVVLFIEYTDQASTIVPLSNVTQMDLQVRK